MEEGGCAHGGAGRDSGSSLDGWLRLAGQDRAGAVLNQPLPPRLSAGTGSGLTLRGDATGRLDAEECAHKVRPGTRLATDPPWALIRPAAGIVRSSSAAVRAVDPARLAPDKRTR